MVIFKRFLLLFSAASIVTIVGLTGNVAMALTPDGETPANEGVCNVLQGATPGLYGLCVAYCEAQDLDSFDKEPPNTKILENYNKKKKATDPAMPCGGCWSTQQFASIANEANKYCTRISYSNGEYIWYGTIDAINRTAHYARIDTRQPSCGYYKKDNDPITSDIITSETISAGLATEYLTLLDTTCTGIGF